LQREHGVVGHTLVVSSSDPSSAAQSTVRDSYVQGTDRA
jgi:hypothetical protein